MASPMTVEHTTTTPDGQWAGKGRQLALPFDPPLTVAGRLAPEHGRDVAGLRETALEWATSRPQWVAGLILGHFDTALHAPQNGHLKEVSFLRWQGTWDIVLKAVGSDGATYRAWVRGTSRRMVIATIVATAKAQRLRWRRMSGR